MLIVQGCALWPGRLSSRCMATEYDPCLASLIWECLVLASPRTGLFSYLGGQTCHEKISVFFCNYQINEWINLLKIKYAKYSKNFKQGAVETQRWEWVRQGSCSRRLVWIESLVVRWSCATPVRGLTCLGNSK